MSIFGKQLQKRIDNDNTAVAKNLKRLGDSVSGRSEILYNESRFTKNRIRQIAIICRELKLPLPDVIRESKNLSEQIDFILQPSGATKRLVELNDIWWKNSDGPLLATFADTDEEIALLPNRFRGYYYFDPETGEKIRITKKNKDLFDKEAFCFYRPLPGVSMTGKDYIWFLLKQIKVSDVLLTVMASIFIAVFGLLTPFATKYAFTHAMPTGEKMLLISLGVLLVSAAVGSWMMSVVKMSANSRISNRLDTISENAVYSRVIRLPASFFGDKSAGGLANRVMALNTLPVLLTEILFGTLITVLVSSVYIFQLITISHKLVFPVFVIYLVEILVFVVTVMQERKLISKRMDGEEKNSGLVFALLSGIQKIKASGSEDRAFAKWMETYSERTKPAYRLPFPSGVRVPLVTAIHMLGLLWIYVIAYNNSLSVSQFASFSSAFGMMMAGINSLGGAGMSVSMIEPVLKMGEPILKEVPETTEGKKTVRALTGRIELNGVEFRYTDDGPNILDGISLKINAGDYVAIVGKSGCGKSTLMRLLLGFEEPQKGTVCYDDDDLESLDKHSLRRNIGTVLQNGKLFTGDIYSNITITAPWMDMDDAWEAAEKAGMANDIRQMPMGMHTLIAEGGGGISGGQKQRLLIARAICPKPNVLMLDEATSALDNLTQKIVTDSMNEMKCTRIVIAHRLSTIKECNRILVLDHGKIAEEGTFDELMAKNGIFTELAKRQIVEEDEEE